MDTCWKNKIYLKKLHCVYQLNPGACHTIYTSSENKQNIQMLHYTFWSICWKITIKHKINLYTSNIFEVKLIIKVMWKSIGKTKLSVRNSRRVYNL